MVPRMHIISLAIGPSTIGGLSPKQLLLPKRGGGPNHFPLWTLKPLNVPQGPIHILMQIRNIVTYRLAPICWANIQTAKSSSILPWKLRYMPLQLLCNFEISHEVRPYFVHVFCYPSQKDFALSEHGSCACVEILQYALYIPLPPSFRPPAAS